jgi:hypothetical protein
MLELLCRRCVDRGVNAEDAKTTEHNGKRYVPTDCSSESEIESGQDGGDRANETENFFVVHKFED